MGDEQQLRRAVAQAFVAGDVVIGDPQPAIRVDADREELDGRVRDFMAASPGDVHYADALDVILASDPGAAGDPEPAGPVDDDRLALDARAMALADTYDLDYATALDRALEEEF